MADGEQVRLLADVMDTVLVTDEESRSVCVALRIRHESLPDGEIHVSLGPVGAGGLPDLIWSLTKTGKQAHDLVALAESYPQETLAACHALMQQQAQADHN